MPLGLSSNYACHDPTPARGPRSLVCLKVLERTELGAGVRVNVPVAFSPLLEVDGLRGRYRRALFAGLGRRELDTLLRSELSPRRLVRSLLRYQTFPERIRVGLRGLRLCDRHLRGERR
uniref:Uncharacterized protein n=1 Tax=uncultured marine virus TaxID=186617 RepID=A0A0F7L6S0_9VIRU|nr:hypothetical protein [uncultured marine virus]